MNALHVLAEPDFVHDAPVQLSARTLGLLLAVYGALYCLAGVPFVIGSHPGESLDTPGRVYAVIGAALPQLLAAIGGVRMFLGEARGKRLVLFSIALWLVYRIADALQFAAEYPGKLAALGPLMETALAIAIAAVLSYLVVTSRFGKDARSWRGALSTIVTIAISGALVLYAVVLLA